MQSFLLFHSLSLLYLCCMFTRPFNFRINKLYALKSEHNFYAIVKTNPSKSNGIQYCVWEGEAKKPEDLSVCQQINETNAMTYRYTKWELLMDFHLLQIHNCFFCCCFFLISVCLSSTLFLAYCRFRCLFVFSEKKRSVLRFEVVSIFF